MHLILLNHCCGRGYKDFIQVVKYYKDKGPVTTEIKHIKTSTIDIMTIMGLTWQDIRSSPYVVICNDNKIPIRWHKIRDWKEQIITKD